jgi:phage tail protein X
MRSNVALRPFILLAAAAIVWLVLAACGEEQRGPQPQTDAVTGAASTPTPVPTYAGVPTAVTPTSSPVPTHHACRCRRANRGYAHLKPGSHACRRANRGYAHLKPCSHACRRANRGYAHLKPCSHACRRANRGYAHLKPCSHAHRRANRGRIHLDSPCHAYRRVKHADTVACPACGDVRRPGMAGGGDAS